MMKKILILSVFLFFVFFADALQNSLDVPEPVAVRYCLRNWSEGGLYNNFGIPAGPFRIDDWPQEK